jgi:TonB family protein
MFDELRRERKSGNAARLVSFAVHGAIILALFDRTPIFVKPSSVAWGMRGKSDEIVYFAHVDGAAVTAKKLLFLHKVRHKPPQPARQAPDALSAGSPHGSLFHGPSVGTEAQPALPLVFPDPVIYPWQLANLKGDVIVEVTIDTQGNVTDTHVLQSLKQDIDEKVVATLKGWHFKPATVDGVAISSRQDVHFHFPS